LYFADVTKLISIGFADVYSPTFMYASAISK